MALRKSRDGTWIVDVSNGINPISLKQRRIVRKGFKTKKEALMFLNDFTKHEYFKNSQEIKQQVQERKDFPCVICWSYDKLLFKETLIDRIENVLNALKEEL